MRKKLVLIGFVLLLIGVPLGLYASQRNCLVAFLTRGHMNFWTAVEILAVFVVLAGLVFALAGFFMGKAQAPETALS